ncbi:hypothetical protein BC936DRAFT_145613 [Jimgerdemannia flammicorona]|uniref:Uncharacterized protein n=1 Tax=Jimgerdemannia flammicorona TaxID=994334 RepID=A0A433DNE4_9FUNG|nr:hypothetical protein BC936DRAFT_145613 [Jimgerdemannia flammicorona]
MSAQYDNPFANPAASSVAEPLFSASASIEADDDILPSSVASSAAPKAKQPASPKPSVSLSGNIGSSTSTNPVNGNGAGLGTGATRAYNEDTLDEPVSVTIMRDLRNVAEKLQQVMIPNGRKDVLKDCTYAPVALRLSPSDVCFLLVPSASLRDKSFRTIFMPNTPFDLDSWHLISTKLSMAYYIYRGSLGPALSLPFPRHQELGLGRPEADNPGLHERVRHRVGRISRRDAERQTAGRDHLLLPVCLRSRLLPLPARRRRHRQPGHFVPLHQVAARDRGIRVGVVRCVFGLVSHVTAKRWGLGTSVGFLAEVHLSNRRAFTRSSCSTSSLRGWCLFPNVTNMWAEWESGEDLLH